MPGNGMVAALFTNTGLVVPAAEREGPGCVVLPGKAMAVGFCRALWECGQLQEPGGSGSRAETVLGGAGRILGHAGRMLEGCCQVAGRHWEDARKILEEAGMMLGECSEDIGSLLRDYRNDSGMLLLV